MYYIELSTGKKEFSELPREICFLEGFSDTTDKGKASMMVLDAKQGTCLVPVFHKDGTRATRYSIELAKLERIVKEHGYTSLDDFYSYLVGTEHEELQIALHEGTVKEYLTNN